MVDGGPESARGVWAGRLGRSPWWRRSSRSREGWSGAGNDSRAPLGTATWLPSPATASSGPNRPATTRARRSLIPRHPSLAGRGKMGRGSVDARKARGRWGRGQAAVGEAVGRWALAGDLRQEVSDRAVGGSRALFLDFANMQREGVVLASFAKKLVWGPVIQMLLEPIYLP